MKKIFLLTFTFIFLSAIFLPKKADAYGECSKYGLMAYESGGYCACMTGYVMGSFLGKPYCISADQACKDEYGYGATSDYLTNRCKCRYGYIFSLDYSGHTKCIDTSQYCRDRIGLNSSYNSLTDSCECSYGYVLTNTAFGQECVSGNQDCRKEYGAMSEYDKISKKCTCSSGYVFTKNSLGDLECKSCSSVHGAYSSYSYLLDACACDNGYTLDDDNQCVKKQNNVYFKLIELDSSNSRALIKSEYDNKYYLVDYRSGCYGPSFNRYLNKQIVVNLGTDFFVDKGDKIVLQDDNEMCEIKDFEKVDSSFSFIENESESVVFGTLININNKETADMNLTNRLKGKILIQTESHGEAWYVNPQDKKRYYMTNGNEAFNIMRKLSVGVNTKDFEAINTNKNIAKKHSGKILLKVEDLGKAYYVNSDGNLHYLKDGNAAYEIMRNLGLGISNNNIRKIEVGK